LKPIDKTFTIERKKKKIPSKEKEDVLGFSVAAGKDRFGEQILLGGRGGRNRLIASFGTGHRWRPVCFEFKCKSGGRATCTTS